MHQISADSCNGLCVKGFHLLSQEGKLHQSDKGDTLFVKQVTSKLTNPKNRYLFLKGRTSSVYAAIAETYWICSGSSKIDPWLTKFLKRALIYSNNGEWYAGYGPRLYANDQLGGVIQTLLESPNSRQAVLSIYDPVKESYQGVKNSLGEEAPNDKSCNNLLYFKIFDDKLDLTVINRSLDVIFGAYSINLPEFTFIQELVAEYLSSQQHTYLNEEDGSIIPPKRIGLGDYITFSDNYHTYRANNQKQAGNDTAQKQFEAVLANYGMTHIDELPDCNLQMDLGNLTRVPPHQIGLKLRTFFQGLIKVLSGELVGREVVENYLKEYRIKEGSTLWAYSFALWGYLFGQNIYEEDCGNDTHFIHVLRSSKFTKFDIIPRGSVI